MESKNGPQNGLKERKANHGGWKPVACRLGLCTALGLVLLAGLLAVAAAVCLRLDAAPAVLPMAAIPLAGAAAFAAAVFFVSAERRQGLVMGALAAAALYLFMLVAALILSKVAIGLNAVILLLVMLFCGAAGGVFAANQISKPKRRRTKVHHAKERTRNHSRAGR